MVIPGDGVDPFARDTAVTRVGDDHFTAEVDPRYAVPGGAPNGGYLTALAARALLERLDVPDPLTVTTHYVAPPRDAPVDLHTEVMKPDGRHRSGAVRVVQDGREVLRVTGVGTDLSRAAGVTHVAADPPDVPPIEQCVDPTGTPGLPPVFDRTTLRATAASFGWAVGQKSGRALLEGWHGIAGADRVSTVGLLFLADAFPPPIFNLPDVPFGWMPTIELTVQVRRRPAPGPLRTRCVANFVTDGYLELDAELWDAEGHPVCLSRQTALVPRPTPEA